MPTLNIIQGCRTLQLTRGQNTLIDEDDFEMVAHLRWNLQRHGRIYYARRLERLPSGKMKAVPMHRLIMNAPHDRDVDHRNGDGLDNRRENLRIATTQQNMRNTRKHRGASKFKGVYRNKHRWRSSLCINGKAINLGCFETEREAAHAYDKAAREHFGEFARTNVDIHGNY